MILRSWTARATSQGALAYQEHFTTSVLPHLRRLEGHRGAYLLRRDDGDDVDLRVHSLWTSLEAVGNFAGPDLETAVVEPEAQAVLTSYDSHVTHYTIVVDTTSGA